MIMKLQIWSMDLIFAVVIFSFTITVVGIIWLHISNGLTASYGNTQGVMYMQAGAMSDVLLSPGTPADWQNVVAATNSLSWTGVAPGIETVAGQPQISLPKLYALMSMAAMNYTASKPLFGIGNDYYIVITSPGPGIGNITIGKNPLAYNASTVFVDRRSATLDGSPVWVIIEVWSGGTPGAASVISSSSNPIPGAVSFAPVTITNTNTVAGTGSNFQQMVFFNPTQSVAYTTNEAYDLGNIRFYQGKTELDSWCESGCNSKSSTNAVFWVQIPGGIGFNGAGTANVLVNMTFLSQTTEYDGQYAGECPTCNSVYARYDNGASVFSFYDDFNGPSLNAGLWTVLQGGGGVTNAVVTASSGLTIAFEGNKLGSVQSVPTSNAFSYIAEDYVSPGSMGPGFAMLEYNYSSSTTNSFGISLVPGSTYYYELQGSKTVGTAVSNQYNIFSIYAIGSFAYGMMNYANLQSIAINPESAYTINYGRNSAGTIYATWFRTRVMPPGGVMSSFGIGTQYS
jgi:hypothetical protein